MYLLQQAKVFQSTLEASIAFVLHKWPFVFWLLFAAILPIDVHSESVTFPNVSLIGLNKYDLFKQYLGTASGGDGTISYGRVTQAMARKALDDARDAGVGLMRVSISGYAPAMLGARGDLDLWRSSPSVFWTIVDAMLDDLDGRGIRLVPVLMWNVTQFPAMTGETVADLIGNPESASWQMLAKFAAEFASRYRARRTILFYELSNELNLVADLDNIGRCDRVKRGKVCDVVGNFSTSEMIVFFDRFAGVVRKADSAALISSGFSIPRRSAEHLRAQPGWVPGGPDWTPDTSEQFSKYVKDVHSAVDIVSIHLYDLPENRRFGASDSVSLLVVAKHAAEQAGKPLFVGEFGEPEPGKAGPGAFTDRMIEKLTELRVPYSAVWVWQFYQFKTYLTHENQNTSPSLEPGYTDFLIDRIRAANAAPGHAVPKVAQVDTTPPRLVLTWPLECALLKGQQRIHAVASDDRGKVSRVDFSLAGRKRSNAAPPYEWNFSADDLFPGEYDITASAFDSAGNMASSSARVFVGRAVESQRCAADKAWVRQ